MPPFFSPNYAWPQPVRCGRHPIGEPGPSTPRRPDRLTGPASLRVATRHQVIGLIHEGLTQARPDTPPEIADEINTQAAALVRENLAMAHEAMRVQRLFDDDRPLLSPHLCATPPSVWCGRRGRNSASDLLAKALLQHGTLMETRSAL
jgi:hypothetical protein